VRTKVKVKSRAKVTPEPRASRSGARVFISYSHRQQEVARRLAADLAGGHPRIPVWIDEQRLELGDPLDNRLRVAVEGCRALILLWSAEALASRYVQSEWLGAFEIGKPIITCALDDTPIPVVLGAFIHIRLDDAHAAALAQIRRALGTLSLRRRTAAVLAERRTATPALSALTSLTQQQVNEVIGALAAGSPDAAADLQSRLDPQIAHLVLEHPREPAVLSLAGYHQKNAFMIAEPRARPGDPRTRDEPHLVEAEAYFQRSLAIDPADPGALNGLGNIYAFRGDFGAAEFFIRRAIDRAGELGMRYDFAEDDLALVLAARRQAAGSPARFPPRRPRRAKSPSRRRPATRATR